MEDRFVDAERVVLGREAAEDRQDRLVELGGDWTMVLPGGGDEEVCGARELREKLEGRISDRVEDTP